MFKKIRHILALIGKSPFNMSLSMLQYPYVLYFEYVIRGGLFGMFPVLSL